MYKSFFGLNETPFSITPNPRYLYMSERHTEALAHLIYGIKDSGGFIQLTGEVGTGKTTLIRSLLQRLPENADVALILNPQLSATEFLTSILAELGIALPKNPGSLKALTDALNQFLLENHSKGRRTVLIVDEAQNFAVDVLEQIRLLTNLETDKQKLLQITLIGQPELRTMLSRNDLRQLAQRITGRYHLQPLSQEDTEKYVRHRLQVAGSSRAIFDTRACRELFRLSAGIPRIINVIADRALLGAYTQDQHEIGPRLVRQAATEVYAVNSKSEAMRKTLLRVAALAGIAAILIGAATYTALRFASTPTPVAVALPTNDQPASTQPETANNPPVAPATPLLQGEPGSNSLEQLIRTSPDQTGTRAAFTSLFKLWGTQFDPNAKLACEFAQQRQLYCLFQKGSLAQLQKLDRPVILTLQDNDGGLHQVVLEQIAGQSAIVDIGGDRHDVPLADVIGLWDGEYLLIWKSQIGAVKSFFPGMRDPGVLWLRQSLATIQGNPIDPMDSDRFDENLEARVRDYQVERRLNVDGLVGQQTQILINTDLGAPAPRLMRAN
jgi:general secretion pathway protein A